MPKLDVRATSRFISDYERAQPLLRACAAGALGDLQRAWMSRPDQALRRYNTVKGLRQRVLEIDVAGGERMFAYWSNQTLFLLGLGTHESTKHYQQTGRVEAEILQCEPLPQSLAKIAGAPFFTFDVEHDWKDFGTEADPSWLAYLDSQQARAVSRIIERAKAMTSKDWYFAIVGGGPGTGKTSVLLSLFERGWECDLVPQVIIEDQVAEYVRSAARIDLADFRVAIGTAEALSHGGVLLVDDPRSLDEIRLVRWLAQTRAFRAVVVAVDPLQLVGDIEDDAFRKLTTGNGGEFIPLTSCYRQKSAVGQAVKRALDAIAASSPYLALAKKASFAQSRREITTLANAMEFPNPGGRFKVLNAPTPSDLRDEVDRLVHARGLWRHCIPYLIAFDDSLGGIPALWMDELRRLSPFTKVPLSRSTEVKGVEFQHSIIVLGESLFLDLESGFEGVTRQGYVARQLIRIPMSRAKDSVTVLVQPRAG